MKATRPHTSRKTATARWGWRPALEVLKFSGELRALERRVAAARFGITVPSEYISPPDSRRVLAK
jgi:hypothetical protein